MKKLILLVILAIIFSITLVTNHLPYSFYLSGWVCYWDSDKVLSSLKNNINLFDEINPFIYSFEVNGKIIDLSNPKLIKEIKNTPKTKRIKLIPTIVNDTIVKLPQQKILKDRKIIHEILNNADLLNSHINEINELVISGDFDGIDIDYENLNPKDYNNFLIFLKKLSEKLHSNEKQLNVTIEPKHILNKSGLDIKIISKYADKINIMCYNYSSNTGQITPLFWVEKIVKKTKKIIPASKISIALALHSWAEDNKSIAEKITLLKKYRIKKVAIWRIGTSDLETISKLAGGC